MTRERIINNFIEINDEFSLSNNFKSNFPISLLNIKTIKGTSGTAICKNCEKKYTIESGSLKYIIYPYTELTIEGLNKIEKKVQGSCCSERCMIDYVKYIAMNNLEPEVIKGIRFEYLEDDVKECLLKNV